MTYSTPAEVLQGEMNSSSVFAWSNYGSTPTIKIRGLEDISGMPPDEGIILQNKTESPIWAFNGQKITRPDSAVEAEITMPTSTKRKDIMDDIDAGILASSYNITYDITDQPDIYSAFKTKLRFKIMI